MLAMMTLPQQMMLSGLQMMQTFTKTYFEASQRLMSQSTDLAEDVADDAQETAQEVNWAAQDALRAAGEHADNAMPV